MQVRPCERHQSGRKGLLIAARWRRRHSCRSWEAGKANKRQNGSWNRHGASRRKGGEENRAAQRIGDLGKFQERTAGTFV